MQVEPVDLQLMVGAMLVEATVARGTHCFQQIRRRYVNIEVDEEGKKVVRVKGNVVRKTLPGRAAEYQPLDVVIHGEQEVSTFIYHCLNLSFYQVKAIEKLLSLLPTLGCPKCAFADPPQRLAVDDGCTCDDLFLSLLTEEQLQRSKKTCFRRQRRGREWFAGVLSQISKKAGLSKVYTNSCMRPTVVTELLKAGYDNRQVMSFTGHKTSAMVQHYSRQLEGMQKEEKKRASALLTSSGRNKLRGAPNNLKRVF